MQAEVIPQCWEHVNTLSICTVMHLWFLASANAGSTWERIELAVIGREGGPRELRHTSRRSNHSFEDLR